MKDFYDLCWECYDKNADYYLQLWYDDVAGHSINCFKCEVCGQEPVRTDELTQKEVS